MQISPEALNQWHNVQEHMQHGKHAAVIQEAGTLLQTLLRKIILNYAPELPAPQRQRLFQLELEFGAHKKGRLEGEINEVQIIRGKGIEAFELGYLVRIVADKQVAFIKQVASILKKDAEVLSSINFGYLQGIRNRHAHYSVEAARTAAQYFISSIELLFSFFEIDIASHTELKAELENLRCENERLKFEFGSVEEINGIVPFYRRYAEIASGMDFIDTCWFARNSQISLGTAELQRTYEQAHYATSQVRKARCVINLDSTGGVPFLLFYRFVKDRQLLKDRFEYRGLRAFSDNNRYVHLPHFVLVYSRNAMDDGFVLLSSFDDETNHQRNLVIRGRKIFGFFCDVYRMLFSSCDRLAIDDLKGHYVRLYGAPSKLADIEVRVDDFYQHMPAAVAERNAAIELWKSAFQL